MLSISSNNLEFRGGWVSPADRRAERITLGMACSALLHALVAVLLIFGLPSVMQSPQPPVEEAIPAELVMQGATIASPQPQQQVAPPPAPIASLTPEPRPAEIAPPEPPRLAPRAEAPPVPKPAPPKPRLGPKPLASSAAEPEPPEKPATPTPPAELPYTEFKSGETIEQNAPPSPAAPSSSVASSRTATGTKPGAGGTASFDIRDVIRIQIVPRWHPDLDALNADDWIVAIHMVINPDGTVDRADIVNDPRLATDPAYRAFAISLRNAVLDSSPLHFPAGVDIPPLDMILKFSSAQARR